MKTRVLFICTANSARSQMAEAILKNVATDSFDVFSAGTHPEPIDPRTLSCIEHCGLSTQGLYSKSIAEFAGESFDYVITLCSKARLECGLPDITGEVMAWDFEDPKTRSGSLPFEMTMKELTERINMFLLVQNKN